jgi:uncharacterized membrane protein YccC
VNFVVGQAGFTVFVVVLFNILVPDGWRTGLVRVQDVAIGAGISVAVGALLWPRGARGVARRSFADLLRAGADHLALALDAALHGGTTGLVEAAADVADARARAVAALEDVALEHGGGHVDRAGWGEVLVEALALEVAADSLGRPRSRERAGCHAAETTITHEGRVVTDKVREEADRIQHVGVRSLVDRPVSMLPVPRSLETCLAAPHPDGLDGAIGLVWVHEWVSLVGDHLH